MAPPHVIGANDVDELSDWHMKYHMFFELGTLDTVVAGLLNVLAIYDAFAGPVIAHPDDDKKKKRGPPPSEK
jgi:hypothetical protein